MLSELLPFTFECATRTFRITYVAPIFFLGMLPLRESENLLATFSTLAKPWRVALGGPGPREGCWDWDIAPGREGGDELR